MATMIPYREWNKLNYIMPKAVITSFVDVAWVFKAESLVRAFEASRVFCICLLVETYNQHIDDSITLEQGFPKLYLRCAIS
jgi:hypothetical protein